MKTRIINRKRLIRILPILTSFHRILNTAKLTERWDQVWRSQTSLHRILNAAMLTERWDQVWRSQTILRQMLDVVVMDGLQRTFHLP